MHRRTIELNQRAWRGVIVDRIGAGGYFRDESSMVVCEEILYMLAIGISPTLVVCEETVKFCEDCNFF